MAAKNVEAIALVRITHDGKTFEIGEKLKLNEDEANQLSNRGFVEILISQKKDDTKNVSKGNKGGE